MKFRAKMTDINTMKEFYGIISTLAKISKICVIQITHKYLHFIIIDKSSGLGRPIVSCKLEKSHFFYEYKMSGVSDTHDEILLEANNDMLSKSLLSLKLSHSNNSVKIKLTNKISPCLTFEIDQGGSISRICTHDIPVSVIPRVQWNCFIVPELPSFDLSLELSNIKIFKNVIERMKSMSSNFINISANNSGDFVVKLETDKATITTYFKDLPTSCPEHIQDEEEYMSSVFIDIKKLSQFLSCENLLSSKIILNFVDEKMLFILYIQDGVIFNYLIPSLIK